MATVYTNGRVNLAIPDFKHKPWNQLIDGNWREIAKLGQQTQGSGAAMIAIPADIQEDLNNTTNLRDALVWIASNFISKSDTGVMNDFDVYNVGLYGSMSNYYKAKETIYKYDCVYLAEYRTDTELDQGEVYVGRSVFSDTETLPALGVALNDADVNGEVQVAVLGSLETKTKWTLSANSGNPSHKYVFVGVDGQLTQWGTPPYEPTGGIQVMGYVESEYSVFLRPSIVWSETETI